MDANQRSEFNNQTNNGANEKGTPGATGKSAENGAPLDHTYPGALGAQAGNQGRDIMGSQPNDPGIPGGSMETQINGGSGTVQGITDSHQRQMEQKSSAYGVLEEPVGNQPEDRGVNVLPQKQPQQQPQAQAYSNNQQGVAGSRAGADQQADAEGVHESNDLAGGLPRSPGNAGASTDRAGSQTGSGAADGGPDVHDSNDAAGGYPRSPGYANRLAGDSNMDDDTGFKRKP